MRTLIRTLLAASAMLGQASMADAQSAGNAAEASHSRIAVAIASDFVSLAGSRENALALVSALRSGTEARLESDAAPEPGSPAGMEARAVFTTFRAPRAMRWDEVIDALSRAQAELARAGIAHPTPEQLRAALASIDTRPARGTR
ncbi:MAG TPA: hypothetical protein VEC19_01515 [Usitatibacter sp.]|nr:hypothetical protein [Usitatibacter sp.]